MLVLALDTSTPAVAAGLVEVTDSGCRLRAESVVVDGKRHGELLALGAREVLAGARADAVVAGTGPGPFTGLRVGLVMAAALSDAWGVPAYGACSLDGLAAPSAAAVTDARRREVYWARYDAAGRRAEGPFVDAPAVVAARLRGVVGRLRGAGAALHAAAFAGFVLDDEQPYPSLLALVEAVAERARAGAPSDPLTPLYLRRPDAVEPGAVKRVTS